MARKDFEVELKINDKLLSEEEARENLFRIFDFILGEAEKGEEETPP